jgi:hypothetical protein
MSADYREAGMLNTIFAAERNALNEGRLNDFVAENYNYSEDYWKLIEKEVNGKRVFYLQDDGDKNLKDSNNKLIKEYNKYFDVFKDLYGLTDNEIAELKSNYQKNMEYYHSAGNFIYDRPIMNMNALQMIEQLRNSGNSYAISNRALQDSKYEYELLSETPEETKAFYNAYAADLIRSITDIASVGLGLPYVAYKGFQMSYGLANVGIDLYEGSSTFGFGNYLNSKVLSYEDYYANNQAQARGQLASLITMTAATSIAASVVAEIQLAKLNQMYINSYLDDLESLSFKNTDFYTFSERYYKNDVVFGKSVVGEYNDYYISMKDNYGGKIYSGFNGTGYLETKIEYAMKNSDIIRFHVDGVSPSRALNFKGSFINDMYGRNPVGCPWTEWELRTITQDVKLLQKTRFYENGIDITGQYLTQLKELGLID